MDEALYQYEVTLLVRKILHVAVTTCDYGWMERYLQTLTFADDKVQLMSLDLMFTEKVNALRSAGIITADSASVIAKAEQIINSEPRDNWEKQARIYGLTIVHQPEIKVDMVRSIINFQNEAGKIYGFTCDKCGRPAHVSESSFATDWKSKRFVSVPCDKCTIPNRLNVSELIRKNESGFR